MDTEHKLANIHSSIHSSSVITLVDLDPEPNLEILDVIGH